MTLIKAVEAGVDVIDTALSPLAMGTSQPPTESMVAALAGTEYDTGLDLAKLDVVIVGGHPGWARQIKEQLPVRAWPHGTTCPASVLASADEVWIQAAYMSHKEFYAIINAVRRAGITVRYFATTGVGKCVEQLKAMS